MTRPQHQVGLGWGRLGYLIRRVTIGSSGQSARNEDLALSWMNRYVSQSDKNDVLIAATPMIAMPVGSAPGLESRESICSIPLVSRCA